MMVQRERRGQMCNSKVGATDLVANPGVGNEDHKAPLLLNKVLNKVIKYCQLDPSVLQRSDGRNVHRHCPQRR